MKGNRLTQEILNLRKIGKDEPVKSYSYFINKKKLELMGSSINFRLPSNSDNFKFIIYRVRPITLNESKDIHKIKDLSYPPSESTKINRCNFPKEPIFYGASNPFTALKESIKHKNQDARHLILSAWELKANTPNFLIHPFIFDSFDPNEEFYKIKLNYLSNLKTALSNQIDEEKLLNILQCLSKVFLNNEDNYCISAAIAYYSFYLTGKYNSSIILYPSLIQKSHSFNFAIERNFVDNYLEMKRFYVMTEDGINLEKNYISNNISVIGHPETNSFNKYTNLNFYRIEDNEALFKDFILKDFSFNSES